VGHLTAKPALKFCVLAMIVRIATEKRLPFEPLVPNAETIAAMEAARRGDMVKVGGIHDLMAELNADD